MEWKRKKASGFVETRSLVPRMACLAAIAVLCFGCTSRPSEQQAGVDLQKWFESRWPRTIAVMEYEVMNKKRDGEKYVIEYRAKARFIKDTSGCVLTCCGPVCFDKQVDGFKWITKASDNPHVVRTGDVFETRGKKTYTKTSGGWLCEER